MDRQTDYLALQVERLADVVEVLAEGLRQVQQWQATHDAVQQERSQRSLNPSKAFWRIAAGVGIVVGTWIVKMIADHVVYVPKNPR